MNKWKKKDRGRGEGVSFGSLSVADAVFAFMVTREDCFVYGRVCLLMGAQFAPNTEKGQVLPIDLKDLSVSVKKGERRARIINDESA